MSEKLGKEVTCETSRKFYLKYMSVNIKFLMGVIWNYFKRITGISVCS